MLYGFVGIYHLVVYEVVIMNFTRYAYNIFMIDNMLNLVLSFYCSSCLMNKDDIFVARAEVHIRNFALNKGAVQGASLTLRGF